MNIPNGGADGDAIQAAACKIDWTKGWFTVSKEIAAWEQAADCDFWLADCFVVFGGEPLRTGLNRIGICSDLESSPAPPLIPIRPI